jgi:ATP-binding cassette subfamily B protein
MKLLFYYIKQYKGILAGALILATINQVFSLLDPQIFQLIIDRYALRINELTTSEFVSGVGLLLLASIGVALVSRIAKSFQDYFVNVITQKVGTRLYADAITHAFSLPYVVFEDQSSGALLQKVQKARSDSQTLITSAINVGFLAVVGMVFVLTYAFFVHWMIGALYVTIIPTLGLTTFLISKKIESAQRKIVLESAELAGSTTETLRNVELVKSLGLEEQETIRLNNVNDKILALELKKVTLIRTLSFIQGTLVNATRSGLLLLMLWLVFSQEISLGQLFTLLFYSFAIFTPLYDLGTVAAQYHEAKASMKALDEILKQPVAPKHPNPKTIGELKDVRFDQVSFSYQTNDVHAVSDISLDLSGGKTIAFVGPSGAGKSTLIKLLVGLYQPTGGKILINDVDSQELDFNDLRSKIGYVSQETQLFAGTIRENLLFVKPTATDQECLDALSAASAMSVIEKGDKGLDSKIGEGGIKLSGGERQRLAIARALLRQPQLIIFDEATSSLDSLTEKMITETIKNITKQFPDLMTVVVAHRLSTVSHADTIYVLEKGKIVESGSHEELTAQSGLYTALWRQQSAQKEIA